MKPVLTDAQVDALLDSVLRASGSALSNYTFKKTLDAMREAVRDIERAVCQHRGEPVKLDRYDAGLLGGQDGMPAYVWHDIIRAELDRAYDFYMDQIDRAAPQPPAPAQVPSVPAGFRLVNEDELIELSDSILGNYYRGQDWERERITNMLAAAPTPPSTKEG